MTHGEYLDEPADTVDWLLAIDRMHQEVQAEMDRKAAKRAR